MSTSYSNVETTSHTSWDEGFTLIELLVVISIISLLAGLLIPSFLNAKLLAKRTVCMATLSTVGTSIGLYQGDFGENIPIHVKNHDPAKYPHPWSWRMLLLPYVPGFDAFNCSAARGGGETIQSVEEIAEMDDPYYKNMNTGSYGIMQYSSSSMELVTFNDTLYIADSFVSSVFPTSAGKIWANPDQSIYVADACAVPGPIEYPSQLPIISKIDNRFVGTNVIQKPSDPEYANPKSSSFIRRFADRHKGTNSVFVDGHVEWFLTEELDTMKEGESNCVWDIE